ncbi:MAG: diacylglycerol/lipid kinase family protein, partial [Cyclobacteriaceae bacterium]
IEEGFNFVTAVGGDGTVNETAQALLNSETALGIIPFGSGNGLARDLSIPLDTTKAINVILQQQVTIIDSAEANGRPFFCTAGVGFDAYISKQFAEQPERGFKTYLKNTLLEFARYQSGDYAIQAEGFDMKYKAFSITFANARQFGNNAFISPLADIRDGQLDLCIVKDYPKHLGINLGLRLFNKSIHKSNYVEIMKITEATVTCPVGSYYHLDGEAFALDEDTLEVKIKPASLKVVTP